MSLNLLVPAPINGVQNVQDPSGNVSGLALGKEMTTVLGRDRVGGTLPLVVTGLVQPADFDQNKTWGRVVRLRANDNTSFYDIGIDKTGNLFINSVSSTKDVHVLTITPAGGLILNMAGITLPPNGIGTVDLCVDKTNGRVYRQG